MATANRVSELANMSRTGLNIKDTKRMIRICVTPGFLYKNQWTPPNIEVVPLMNQDTTICPVERLLEIR